MDLITFQKRFGADEACRAHLELVLWPDGPVCTTCADSARVSVRTRRYGRGTDRPMILVAVERGGRVHVQPLATHSRDAIKAALDGLLAPSAVAMTDGLPAYRHLGGVDVDTGLRVHVNTAEGFNATMKRAVVGVFHRISRKHPVRYACETSFRWNRRARAPARDAAPRPRTVPALRSAHRSYGMIQSRAYRFKAMLEAAEAQSFARFGGGCRWLWNRLLHLNKERYEREKTFIFYHEMTALLPGLKKEFPWLAEVPAAALQRVCRNLDKALKDCFQKGKGFPKPKRKKDLADAFYMTNQQVTTVVRTGRRAGLIAIPKVGKVKVRGGRWPFAAEELERIEANLFPKITSATARMDGGDWYIAVQTEVDVLDPEAPTGSVVAAADLGLKDLATPNDGTRLPNPRRLRQAEKRLKRKQRQVSRAKKGSKNRRKRAMALSRLHARVRRFRHGFIHQFTSWLTTKADVICVEDLAVKALMRTRMATSIGDAAWGEIVRQLTYKAEWKGKSVVKIDRWLPSSQVCSGCGQVHSEMKDLKVRRMVCECGVDLDRDHNAALNVLRRGLEVWRNQVGQGMAEPTPLRVNACGEPSAGAGTVVPFATGSARHGSPKQELTGICTTQHLVAAA